MSKLIWKFDNKEAVLYKDEEHVIRSRRAIWKTGERKYWLVDVNTPVDESELKKAEQKKTEDSGLESVRQEYAKVFGKPVAPSRKNNLEWMKTKIAEEKSQEFANKNDDTVQHSITYEEVQEMEASELISKLLEAGYSEEDVKAFETEEELREALIEELEIQKP